MEQTYLQELEATLKHITDHLRQELRNVRSSRPSVELLEDISVVCYDQPMTLKQVASLSVVPPREIQLSVWDKTVVATIIKAIESVKMGLSVANDGNLIRVSLPPLSSERRQELAKQVKKTSEASRIQIRHYRDEMIKKVKAAEDKNELTEDDVFKLKEKIQGSVEQSNNEIEKIVENKVTELND